MNRLATASGSPQDTSDAALEPPRPRLAWLDLFRGAAVLVMIETHVVNTFLAGGFREGGWFAMLNYVNGLVAPSFLFIAGFVQGMERRKAPGKPIPYARRAGRLLAIAALGYALHFPFGALAGHRWSEALRVGSQIDVLQCLALGLGLLLGVSWLTGKLMPRSAIPAADDGGKAPGGDSPSSSIHLGRSLPPFVWSLGVVALALTAVLAAPLVQIWAGGPVIVRAWLNATTGSLFPLFPWVGFVFLGALMGAWPVRALPGRAAAMICLALLAWSCRGTVFSAVSPSFFLERAVWVLALAAFCEWSERHTLPRLVLYAGKHSLKLYVAHLTVITALVGAGVSPVALGLPVTLGLLAGVGAVSFGAARFLDRLPQFLRQVRPSEAPAIVVAEDLPSPAA